MKKMAEAENEEPRPRDDSLIIDHGETDGIRLRILRGAMTTFGRLGYGATSVESILEEAGVSRRTFYKHFRSKEDVFHALYDRAVEQLLHAVRTAEVPAEGGVVARVIRAVEAYIDAHEKAGPFANVMLLEQFTPGSLLAQQRQEAMATFARLISNAARRAGVIDLDPLVVSGVVAGINAICVECASNADMNGWDTTRALAAIRKLLRGLGD